MIFPYFSKLLRKTHGAAGESPGTVSYVGRKHEGPVTIDVIDYSDNSFDERRIQKLSELEKYRKNNSITWINVSGVHDVGIIEELGDLFNLHPLTLEDITKTTQRPKVDEYDRYLYAIIKMAYYDKGKDHLTIEQVSLVMGEDFVLSFEEHKQDILGPLRERIRGAKGKIRRKGSDYLCYSIIDTVVDHYFSVLERFGEDIERIEERLIAMPNRNTLNDIYRIKRELIFLRRAIWPIRDVVNMFARNDFSLTKKETEMYFRDVYDHVVQITDTVESFRDMVGSMLDLYMSTISVKMNEVMKVLTVLGTIFIPLTFLTGIYGMNFKYFPEIEWQHGYLFFWGVAIGITLIMLFYFKKKKWL